MRLNNPPLVQPYHLARLGLWARLWLAWVASVLARFSYGLPEEFERSVRARLDQCADLLAHVIFLRAFARLQRARVGHEQNLPAARRRYAGMRIVLGSLLRRALRGENAATKLAALAHVVGNMETHIAKLARRLARGLTRRRVFALAPDHQARMLMAACLRATCADTS